MEATELRGGHDSHNTPLPIADRDRSDGFFMPLGGRLGSAGYATYVRARPPRGTRPFDCGLPR